VSGVVRDPSWCWCDECGQWRAVEVVGWRSPDLGVLWRYVCAECRARLSRRTIEATLSPEVVGGGR